MASGRLKFFEIENIDPISEFPGYFVVWSYKYVITSFVSPIVIGGSNISP